MGSLGRCSSAPPPEALHDRGSSHSFTFYFFYFLHLCVKLFKISTPTLFKKNDISLLNQKKSSRGALNYAKKKFFFLIFIGKAKNKERGPTSAFDRKKLCPEWLNAKDEVAAFGGPKEAIKLPPRPTGAEA